MLDIQSLKIVTKLFSNKVIMNNKKWIVLKKLV